MGEQEPTRTDPDDAWTGVALILVGITAPSLLAVYAPDGATDADVLVGGGALVLCGLFVLLDPGIGTVGEHAEWWDGAFWIAVGCGVLGVALLVNPHARTKLSGLLIGGTIVLVGVIVLLRCL